MVMKGKDHSASDDIEVTQDNLGLFLPGKIAGVAALLSKETGRPILDSMRDFYATDVCKLLEREETKYWHYSAAQLYTLLHE